MRWERGQLDATAAEAEGEVRGEVGGAEVRLDEREVGEEEGEEADWETDDDVGGEAGAEGAAAVDPDGGPHRTARRGRATPRWFEDWLSHSARFLIPNELLDDPEAYFRTRYTDYPDTYPEF